jgi:hypothetical protein
LTYWFVQKQATAVILEQLTCATASVRQLVTTQLEVWGWGKEQKKKKTRKKEKGQLGRGKMEMEMALFLACNETYHTWSNP